MKKIVTVTEVDGEGFEAFLGKEILIFCMNYIYTGTLSGVNQECVLLEKAKIVYETGAFDSSGYKNAQSLPQDVAYIQKASVEMFCHSK